ncbi:molybdopterin-dependent oxidoreductase, partial [Klebsiella pneumoniae]
GFAAVTAPIEEIACAEVVLMVGSNPDSNHPVAASFMKNAFRRGTKLILVDPGIQALSRFATHHLRTAPGTDVALLSAMTRVVIEEGLHDRDFVSGRLEGFEALRARVAPFTPEMAAGLTGVPAQDIVAAARLFAGTRAAMTFWGMGASQHAFGADNIRAVIA